MKNTLIFLSLLLLVSCKKEDTPDDVTPPVDPWQKSIAAFPKEIKVKDYLLGNPTTRTFLISFDSIENILEVYEKLDTLDDDPQKKLRIRNEYNADGYLIKQLYIPSVAVEPYTSIVVRDDKNNIRWILSDYRVRTVYDTCYFTYKEAAEGLNIATVLTPYIYREEEAPVHYDTTYMYYDKSNRIKKIHTTTFGDQRVSIWEQLYTYNAGGSLKNTTGKFISYFEDEYPVNYIDSTFSYTEFLYAGEANSTGATEGMNQLSLGRNHYLFTTENFYFVTQIAHILNANFGIDARAFSPFRPVEQSFYNSVSPEQEAPKTFFYENNDNGDLSVWTIKENGNLYIIYEFKY